MAKEFVNGVRIERDPRGQRESFRARQSDGNWVRVSATVGPEPTRATDRRRFLASLSARAI